jgi:hypothetical protein
LFDEKKSEVENLMSGSLKGNSWLRFQVEYDEYIAISTTSQRRQNNTYR